MADQSSESHLSTGARAETPAGPLKQHHRMATGERVNGQSNPNGAARGDTDCKVANGGGKTY